MSTVKSRTTDMTRGPIAKQIVVFAFPLMLGNLFQMMYNTADTIVVGNFVGKEALAAVGATSMITNLAVFFFSGFASGASVAIGRAFGAKDHETVHNAVETAITMTIIFSVIFTVVGIPMAKPILRWMGTPEDVFPDAAKYLQIYFAGISGLLIYNLGSGILRSVGDSKRPLYFLIFTSILNIVLDVLFVVVFHAGIAGVAWATIISQFLSAILILVLLSTANDVYRLTWHDLHMDPKLLRFIVSVGLPAGLQSGFTALSNIVMQSYINFFGSDVMAAWSSYTKVDQFVMLPASSMGLSATTFVSQNVGAKEFQRAEKGSLTAAAISAAVCGVIQVLGWIAAPAVIRLFTSDAPVIAQGVQFIRINFLFITANVIDNVMMSTMRGYGDSRGPMIIMMSTHVLFRQLYLYVVTHFFFNTPAAVGFAYPAGWLSCCVMMTCYYLYRKRTGFFTNAQLHS